MQHALPALAMAAAVVASGAMAHGDERHAAAPKKFDASKVKETVFGREGDPKKVSRTIRIDMADTMRFTPGTFRQYFSYASKTTSMPGVKETKR